MRVVSAFFVSPWCVGGSFWKPGFFIFWLLFALLKQNGKSRLSLMFVFPAVSSLIITLYPYVSLDHSLLTKLTAFDESRLSGHSIFHSHTVKLPLGLLREYITIKIQADSGSPWLDYVPGEIILLHAIGILVGLREIVSLSYNDTLKVFGGFGIALSFFDGGALAPYAVAGLLTISAPRAMFPVLIASIPLAFNYFWFESFAVFLSATLLVTRSRWFLSLTILTALVSLRMNWVAKPFRMIPVSAEIFSIDPITLKINRTINDKEQFLFQITKPFPPFWDFIEVNSISCHKDHGFTEELNLVTPPHIGGVVENSFGKMEIQDGDLKIDFQGCVPNAYQQATRIFLRELNITKGVLSNSRSLT